MGNTANKVVAALPGLMTYDKQEECGFTYLPEEMLVAIVEYFDLKDFITLITTCKYYNYELIGQSNVLWAHICRSLGNINFIIRSIQFGRRWKIEGQTIDLNKAIDLTDKTMVAAFNFREIVEEYYLRILHKSSLRDFMQQLMSHLQFYNFLITVEVEQYSESKLRNYWTPDLKNYKKFRLDYFFVVDLDMDPAAVDKITDFGLKYSKGGRIVAYKKSKRDPGTRRLPTNTSRAEMERQFIATMKELSKKENNQQ